MSVGVVGLGLIGGSIALGLRDKYEVIGVDLDPKTLEIAKEKGICQKVSDSLLDLNGVEVVFVAVPINSVAGVVKSLSQYDMVIADVGSLKLDLANSLNDIPNFVGTHPMAGREKGGISASDQSLFENALWMVDSTRPTAVIEKVTPYIEALGAYTFLIDPDSHDQMVAAVSHLPHLVAVALTLAAEKISGGDDRLFLMAAGGFRDTTRIASGDPKLWQQILSQSPYLKDAASAFAEIFNKLCKEEELTPYLKEACTIREKLPFRGKGVVGEVFSLVIKVEDKPGEIGEITSILAKKHINIKEIEILKQREGETGPLRLGFSSSKKALEAYNLLKELGYTLEARW
ncbi:MAG: prephenate dehydrogenase/arogenate dehydrogenase family protein [Firmicutes bacterium]|nr:prephenate dehydrogenase/arogenate dehydrogenase family protein [Bacillota bacterium]MDD4693111.1 prephenate dehydrogenase/arogenate dehydrogenase family protein [Bacillota bacterium]